MKKMEEDLSVDVVVEAVGQGALDGERLVQEPLVERLRSVTHASATVFSSEQILTLKSG